MIIKIFRLGELNSNCYIVETAPGRCIIVDIGNSPGVVLKYLKIHDMKLTKILLTHGHFDHIGGVEEVRGTTGAEVFIHESDESMLESSILSLHSSISIMPFKPILNYTVVRGDNFINDGKCSFRVLHTPGHSPGSVCYICYNDIFSGDTIFRCSVGRTDFPNSNAGYLKRSLENLYDLQGDYNIYPGHSESTTLNYERMNNPYMRLFRK